MGQIKNIDNEIAVLESAHHENIIKMTEKLRSENHYYLILEYCNGGNMADYLE